MLNYRRLSKKISFALRHRPDKFGLVLDSEGWVTLEDLFGVLAMDNPKGWSYLNQIDLEKMIAAAEKTRFEIRDGRIRALYGHSTKQKIEKPSSKPPFILYHGTARRTVPLIQDTGLRSMKRQYVHLSADKETAIMVGKRHDAKPALLEVDAITAHQKGIKFYQENNGIWLSESIPPQFIDFGHKRD